MKKTTIKFLFVICILFISILFISIALTIIVLVNKSSVYDFERFYEEYKTSYDMVGVPVMNFEILKEYSILENDRFQVTYQKDSSSSISGVHFIIYDKKMEKIYNIEDTMYLLLYDNSNNWVSTLYQIPADQGYYNPYEKDYEPCMWIESENNKIVISFLAIERFFVSESILPNSLTIEDYNKLISDLMVDEENSFIASRIKNIYILKSELDIEVLTQKWRLDKIASAKLYKDDFYILKEFSASSYKNVFEPLIELGMTVEDKRKLESKIIKDNYEAYMAMITLTVDLTGEYPTIDLDYHMISPDKHNVTDIYWGRENFDWNEYFREIYLAK